MKGASFLATIGQTAHAHPFVDASPYQLPGFPIGINLRNRSLVCIDFWLLKQLGNIHSTFVQIFGPKDCGKSGLLKLFGVYGLMRVAYYDKMRVVIHDRKPEGEESEYSALSRRTNCKPFYMGDMQANPFERRLYLRQTDNDDVYELGIIEMAKLLAEYNSNIPLSELEYDALRVAVFEMIYQYLEENWSPPVLAKICASPDPHMLERYEVALHNKLVAQAEERAAKAENNEVRDRMTAEIKELANRPRLLQFSELAAASMSLAIRLENLLEGELGRIIGSRHSLYELNTQQATVKIWQGMTEKAETLARIIDTRISLLASELNRADLLPHIVIDDERHRSMENLEYAKTLSYQSEIARANYTLNMGGSHWHSSLRKGGAGSELWNIGDLVIRNSGLRIYGRLANDPAMVREVMDMNHLTPTEATMLTVLPNYCFGAKLYGESGPMVFFRAIAPQILLRDIMQTNSAASLMSTPTEIGSYAWLWEYAKRNGLELIT